MLSIRNIVLSCSKITCTVHSQHRSIFLLRLAMHKFVCKAATLLNDDVVRNVFISSTHIKCFIQKECAHFIPLRVVFAELYSESSLI